MASRLKIDKAFGDKLAPKLAATFAKYKTVPKVAAKLGISRESFNKLCKLSPTFEKTYREIGDGIDVGTPGPPKTITKELGDCLAPKLADLFRSGEDVLEVCAVLCITSSAFYKLLDVSPKFNLAYQHGHVNSGAWWHRLNRGVAAGKVSGNARSIESIMQNKFGWARKNENTNDTRTELDVTLDFDKLKPKTAAAILDAIRSNKT